MGGDSSLWCHEFESQHQSQTPLKEFNRCRQRQIWHWVVEVVKWSVCSPSTTTIWVRISLKPTVLSVKLWLKRTKIQKKGPGLCHLEKLTSSLGQLRQVFLRGSAFCCSYFRSCSTFYEQNKIVLNLSFIGDVYFKSQNLCVQHRLWINLFKVNQNILFNYKINFKTYRYGIKYQVILLLYLV